MADISHTPINHLLNTQNMSSSHRPKEAEPFAPKPKENLVIQEVVDHENVDEEVKSHVEVRKENIKLPPELKKAGLEPTHSTTFHSYQTLVKLPESDEKVVQGLHQPITNSARWLALFCIYLLNQAHLSLKVVGGRVVRVLKR